MSTRMWMYGHQILAEVSPADDDSTRSTPAAQVTLAAVATQNALEFGYIGMYIWSILPPDISPDFIGLPLSFVVGWGTLHCSCMCPVK